MKTLKEIHESQGGKFGYKVMQADGVGGIRKVVGFDPEDGTFFLRNTVGGIEVYWLSAAAMFTLIEEPMEIWVNIYKPSPGSYEVMAYTTEAEARSLWQASRIEILRTAKFREVIET